MERRRRKRRKRKRTRIKRSDCNTAAFGLRGRQHGVSKIVACHLYDRCVACRISATHAGVTMSSIIVRL